MRRRNCSSESPHSGVRPHDVAVRSPAIRNGGKMIRFVSLLAPIACLCLALAGASCQWPPSDQKARPKPRSAETPPKKPVSLRVLAEGGTIQAVKKRGELRVGMQVGYVPFEMVGSKGTLVGMDVDAAQLVARSLMVNLRIVRQNWQDLIPSLLSGDTDVIMSGMNITPARNAEVLFTAPVLESGRMFVIRPENGARFKKFRDLDQPGVFIVSGPGGVGALHVKELLPKASYREFKTRKAALAEVLEKRAHALVDEEFYVRLAAASHPGSLTPRFQAVTYEPIAWAVRPGDTHWLNWLNNFIRTMQKDGTLDTLKKKWLQDYFLDINRGSGRR